MWIFFKNYNVYSGYIGEDKDFIKLNCTKDTYNSIDFTIYDKYGAVNYSRTYSKYEQQDQYIPPGSVIEAIKNRVCYN